MKLRLEGARTEAQHESLTNGFSSSKTARTISDGNEALRALI